MSPAYWWTKEYVKLTEQQWIELKFGSRISQSWLLEWNSGVAQSKWNRWCLKWQLKQCAEWCERPSQWSQARWAPPLSGQMPPVQMVSAWRPARRDRGLRLDGQNCSPRTSVPVRRRRPGQRRSALGRLRVSRHTMHMSEASPCAFHYATWRGKTIFFFQNIFAL